MSDTPATTNTATARPQPNGWGKSPASPKWHYFDPGVDNGHTSLCGTIGFYFGPTEQGKDNSPDNCARCRKKLAALREKRAAGPETRAELIAAINAQARVYAGASMTIACASKSKAELKALLVRYSEAARLETESRAAFGQGDEVRGHRLHAAAEHVFLDGKSTDEAMRLALVRWPEA